MFSELNMESESEPSLSMRSLRSCSVKWMVSSRLSSTDSTSLVSS